MHEAGTYTVHTNIYAGVVHGQFTRQCNEGSLARGTRATISSPNHINYLSNIYGAFCTTRNVRTRLGEEIGMSKKRFGSEADRDAAVSSGSNDGARKLCPARLRS